MNSTVAFAQTQLPEVSTGLWLHILLTSAFSCVCVPAIIICKFQDSRYLRIIQVFAVIVTLLATISSFFISHGSPFTTHGTLGLSILLVFGTFLIYDISQSRNQKLESSWKIYIPDWKPLPFVTSCFLVIVLAVETVFGLASLFNFCAYPYTQQCFGHFGVGGWIFLLFGFCAVMSLTGETWLRIKRVWTPEMADSVLLIPAGLGLTFFGHGWSDPWDPESLQHVIIGLFCTTGGTLDLLLPQRTIFTGLVSLVAGYTFLTHPQDPSFHLLGDLHRVIGYLFCGIGVCRIVDVGFAFYQPHEEERNLFASPWGYLASFLGICNGLVIMSANEEEAVLLDAVGVRSTVLFLWLLGLAMGVYSYLYVLVRAATPRNKVGYAAVEMEEV